MPVGTCDPATRGDTWNEGQLTVGDVTVDYRYGWDGTSVRPDCVGPLNRVRVSNLSATDTWYVHFRGRRGQPRTITLTPGFGRVYSTAQLAQAGFADNTDLESMRITDSPVPPVDVAPR